MNLGGPNPECLFGSQDAEGMIALASGDVKGAESKFQTAVDIANKYPAISREIRLSAKQRLCSVQTQGWRCPQRGAVFSQFESRDCFIRRTGGWQSAAIRFWHRPSASYFRASMTTQ